MEWHILNSGVKCAKRGVKTIEMSLQDDSLLVLERFFSEKNEKRACFVFTEFSNPLSPKKHKTWAEEGFTDNLFFLY